MGNNYYHSHCYDYNDDSLFCSLPSFTRRKHIATYTVAEVLKDTAILGGERKNVLYNTFLVTLHEQKLWKKIVHNKKGDESQNNPTDHTV